MILYCFHTTKTNIDVDYVAFLLYIRESHGPGVDSVSNRNEYQENFLGLNSAGA